MDATERPILGSVRRRDRPTTCSRLAVQIEHRGKRSKLDTSRESTTSTINTPSPITMSVDKSLVQNEDALSDYDIALNLLKNNPPENRLDISLSYSQYLKLEECWSSKVGERHFGGSEVSILVVQWSHHIVTVVTGPRDLHA
ncbi:hypothetical protein V1506DRAFT_549761 [Lipomyces tetrasporus]